MRINLKTPFAEKDAAKALGARWDGSRKIWYITDIADLTPFLRWIPDVQAATEDSVANAPTSTSTPTGTVAPSPARRSPGVITKPANPAALCGCKVLPWEACEHTATL